ncbi:ABC transporter permease [Chloroflexota bacterium]
MTRFSRLLANEFQLFRTAIPIHLVALLQPTVMYLLMGVIMVHPTFDMYVSRQVVREYPALVTAMEEVGSPIGPAYIRPVPVDSDGGSIDRQLVTVEMRDDTLTAVQRYGLIDSNLVKNLRNRLTAAALRLWHADLGAGAVSVTQHPWLPWDVPYTVYFGMAMIPMTVFLAASIIGGFLTAQEFELRTIVEYRLAPAPVAMVLGARLTRLVLMGFLSAAILVTAIGLVNGAWPDSLWRIALIVLPVAVIAGCLGIVAGLVMRKVIPAFMVGLLASFVGWIMGSAFGLASGFGGLYEFISRLTPNTHAVELMFPLYYGTRVGQPLVSVAVLAGCALTMMALTALVYRWRVLGQE